MKTSGAVAILTTMLLGLFAWAGSSIVENSNNISRLEAEEQNTTELLKEVRGDVKAILRALPKE